MWQKVNISIHTPLDKSSFLENLFQTNDGISLQKEGETGEIHILKKAYLLFVTYFPLSYRGTAKVLSRVTELALLSGPEESIK